MKLMPGGRAASLFAALHFTVGCLGSTPSSLLSATKTTPADLNYPSGTPFPGDYGGQYRPQVHYSAPQNFMSDPNGIFRDASGTWHLYYQYNPLGLSFGNQHWGHATSKDLYHWASQPIALGPPNRHTTALFSGSTVVDRNNTSGLFPNQDNGVVSVFTLAGRDPDGGFGGPQVQSLAYSHDGGFNFQFYEHNPVINSTSNQFRDPRVMAYKDHWVMVIAYSRDFTIGIYTSPNLLDWTHASNFSLHGLLGAQWECPNLIQMPYIDEECHRQDDVWTLFVNINPGGPLGGAVVQYFPGSFNGTHFKPVDSAARTVDSGKDYYAMQFFNNIGPGTEVEYPVSIAWASNWQYTQLVPTGQEGWRSSMSLPRRHYMTKIKGVGWKLVSQPYNLERVMGDTLAVQKNVTKEVVAVEFSGVKSNAVFWEVNITGIPERALRSLSLNVSFVSPSTTESVRLAYVFGGVDFDLYGGDTPFSLDRGGAKGFDHRFFTHRFSVSSPHDDGTWSASGVLDRSLLEVFIHGGIETVTSTFFTQEPVAVVLFSLSPDLPKGLSVDLRVVGLNSAWDNQASHDGLVYGNRTIKG
ncbi:Invertase [Conoideocrella luteorostrata]|uniref:Invertase n=1 Tax=Conoideocrella luteorostrata TaxID=1105319 RepID=A0AAJ0CV84_9HYPO|nr:Invertase [Conoideocrella luteorostrata]